MQTQCFSLYIRRQQCFDYRVNIAKPRRIQSETRFRKEFQWHSVEIQAVVMTPSRMVIECHKLRNFNSSTCYANASIQMVLPVLLELAEDVHRFESMTNYMSPVGSWLLSRLCDILCKHRTKNGASKRVEACRRHIAQRLTLPFNSAMGALVCQRVIQLSCCCMP